jgi:hypothetical protein
MASDKLIMNDNLVRILEEEIISSFVVLSCHLSGGSQESHEVIQFNSIYFIHGSLYMIWDTSLVRIIKFMAEK